MGDELPQRIWLLPNAGNDGETLWCDDPAPGIGMKAADAVEYVRADALIEVEKRGAERMRGLKVAGTRMTHFGEIVSIEGVSRELILVSVLARNGLQPKVTLLPHQLYTERVRVLEAEGDVVVSAIPYAGEQLNVSAALRALPLTEETPDAE